MTKFDWSRVPNEFLELYTETMLPGETLAYAAQLENEVSDKIKAAMPSLNRDLTEALFDGYGPLASFNGKIDVARALGLISGEQRTILHAIRKIRNEFAHAQVPLTFEDPKVIKIAKALPQRGEGAHFDFTMATLDLLRLFTNEAIDRAKIAKSR